jgi:hypothetical protein
MVENLAKSLDFLNLQELPANFRDAVSIARELDIQYIWIDSMCIIQDGDNGQDLRRELVKMGSIYQNANLTIAAVSAPNSSEGCFIKDAWPDICFLVSNSTHETHLIGARVLDKKDRLTSLDDVNDCCLSTKRPKYCPRTLRVFTSLYQRKSDTLDTTKKD